MDARKALGQHLKTLRKLRGLSQDGLADKIGIDPKSVSRLETGGHYPSLETLEKLTEALGVTWGDLFAFDDRPAAEALRAKLHRRIDDAGYEELVVIAVALDTLSS